MSSTRKQGTEPGDEIAARLLERALRGENLEIEALLSEQPMLAEALRERLRSMAQALDTGAAPRAVGGGAARCFGHFEIVRELGRGAQGTVFLARDTRLMRRVALKVLNRPDLALPGESSQSGPAARLRREAEIASKLDHPGICVVHEVGVEAGLAYIAMRYVEGQTLAQAIAAARERGASSLGGPEELLHTLALVERIARTLHSAHQAQVVHRDIKPANVMITAAGEPVILDFGLARDNESSAPGLTGSGELIGSPAYMAPEQIEQQRGAIDARTDVYALGVLLYECLTLQRPFESPTRDGLYHAILESTPPDPRRLVATLPLEVVVVLAAALEKQPERRYASALDFAEELRRIREHEPIRARPAGPWLRLRRWAQRNPGLSAALCAALLALSGFALREQVTRRKDQASQLHSRALAVRESDPASALALEVAAAETGSLGRSVTDAQLLASLAALHEVRCVRVHDGLGMPLLSCADGRIIVAIGGEHEVRLLASPSLEPLAGQPRLSFRTPPSIALSPDGRWLVTQSEFEPARLWDTNTFEARTIGEAEANVLYAFAPDSKRLVRASRTRIEVSWVDRSHGTSTLALDGIHDLVDLGCSPDGGLLWLRREQELLLVNLQSEVTFGLKHAEALSNTNLPIAVQGSCCLLARHEGLVRLDAARGFVPEPLGFESARRKEEIVLVRLAPGGARALLAYRGGGAESVALEGASGALTLDAGRLPIVEACFSADGSRIALLGEDHHARVCNAETGQLVCELASADPVASISWNETDARAPLLTAHVSGALRRWSLASALESRDVRCTGPVCDAHGCDVAAGRLAASAGLEVVVETLATPRQRTRLELTRGRARWIDMDRGGRWLAAACEQHAALVFALGTNDAPRVLEHDATLWSSEFSPDGRLLATAGENGEIRLYDTRDWSFAALPRPNECGLRCLAFDAGGKFLASVSEMEGCVRVWSLAERRAIASLPVGTNSVTGTHAPVCASFDPSGERIAITTFDGKVVLWDWRTGESRTFDPALPLGHRDGLNGVAFDSAGERIAAASNAGCVVLVSATDGELVGRYDAPGSNLRGLDLVAAENLLVAQDLHNGVARVFPLDPLPFAKQVLHRLEAGTR